MSSLALTVGWGGISKFDVGSLKGHADSIIPLLQLAQKFSWLTAVTAMLVAACSFGMRIIGPPWVRHAIKKVLDEMHSDAFGKLNRSEFHDRVTLFKYEKICFRSGRTKKSPFGGFLVPFVRSGFMTERPSVVFRTPDNADFEGVAGYAFTSNTCIACENLPDVSTNVNPSAADYKKYAGATFVGVEWLKNERSSARSLYGIPVRVDGRPWGAIVVDSRQMAIQNSNAVVNSYKLVASVLGQLIRRS